MAWMKSEYWLKENWWCVQDARTLFRALYKLLLAEVWMEGGISFRSLFKPEQHSLVRGIIRDISLFFPPVLIPWILRYGVVICLGQVVWWGWRAKTPNSWLLNLKGCNKNIWKKKQPGKVHLHIYNCLQIRKPYELFRKREQIWKKIKNL